MNLRAILRSVTRFVHLALNFVFNFWERSIWSDGASSDVAVVVVVGAITSRLSKRAVLFLD